MILEISSCLLSWPDQFEGENLVWEKHPGLLPLRKRPVDLFLSVVFPADMPSLHIVDDGYNRHALPSHAKAKIIKGNVKEEARAGGDPETESNMLTCEHSKRKPYIFSRGNLKA